MNVVIDTSVIFKWFVAWGESGLDEAGKLLRMHRDGDITLVAPASVAVELANLLRYVGLEAADAPGYFEDFSAIRVRTYPETPARIQQALECAFAHRISVYDAMFLALAKELDCPLVTADRRAFGGIPSSAAEVRLLL